MTTDVLGYSGKRVIVAGAAGAIGVATVELLVDLGVEVHAIDRATPDVHGLASFTECDLDDSTQVDAAIARIGRIVNMLFVCVDGRGVAHLVEQVAAGMLPDGAIAGVADLGTAPPVRLNSVRAADEASPLDVAWVLVLLNSPRAAAVTGAGLALG